MSTSPIGDTTPSQPEPLLISAEEAAKLLGLSAKLVWSMTKAGELPVVRVRRRTMYSPAALRLWIENNTEGPRS